MKNDDQHWLTRRDSIRVIWIVFGAVLGLTVAVQFLVPVKGAFEMEKSFGFGAWFGFGACLLMVIVAKVLGWLLKRTEGYYETAGDGTDAQEDHDER